MVKLPATIGPNGRWSELRGARKLGCNDGVLETPLLTPRRRCREPLDTRFPRPPGKDWLRSGSLRFVAYAVCSFAVNRGGRRDGR
jgi:hypothetical protein